MVENDMSHDRSIQAPEMTPMVDPLVDPGSKTQPAEGGRDEVDETPEAEPGWVPGPAGTMQEGASTLGRDEEVKDKR
jgi:hypothetical protein